LHEKFRRVLKFFKTSPKRNKSSDDDKKVTPSLDQDPVLASAEKLFGGKTEMNPTALTGKVKVHTTTSMVLQL
jgi:hypothetical protein